MLIPNHPHDERLAAYADGDADVRADASLVDHVATCLRCTGVVDELGALRAVLGDLPDLAPSRPLRLLPPVADAPVAAGAGGWLRRFFAPVMTAGAALAVVGLVGTTLPAMSGQAGGAGPLDNAVEMSTQREPAGAEVIATASTPVGLTGAGGADASDGGAAAPDEAESSPLTAMNEQDPEDGDQSSGERLAAETERPIWPMLLFAGVAILIGAPLLRWILVPRAG